VPPPPPPPDCPALAQKDLKPLIDAAAQKQSLQPELLVAVASALSSLKPCAVSPSGAAGLFQLAPDTVTSLKVTDPLDPKQNVDAGAAFLKQLADKNKGDMKIALAVLYQSAAGNPQPTSPDAEKFAADVLADAAKPAPAVSPKSAK
jgi:soluble lytic murein transglycosylase-like protein